MSKIISFFTLFLILVSCSDEDYLFENPRAEDTGITFENTLTETDDLNILDYLYFYNGGGLAIGDINNDGLPDIFFSGNQIKNRLYLNKGNLKFEDITEQAGVAGNSSWNTGAVMADINGDGFLDIYVCAVVGINGFNGYNELYINDGASATKSDRAENEPSNSQDSSSTNEQATVSFTESAAEYGLDFDSFSSNAAFLDYDRDGDLDLYLLNHAVHTQESFGKADLRNQRNYQTGDKLLRNDDGKFTDVSEEAGIYGGINGYGLGLAVSDFNQDGWPDIYVGNDFHEDDYYYLNNGSTAALPNPELADIKTSPDSASASKLEVNSPQPKSEIVTFTESGKQFFGHTSRFSMGNDVADINHDGWPDLISLDMLPEDETVLKSSQGDDNVQTQKMRTENYGYRYQFTRNMLNINQQNATFLETALMSGVAASDWSWSALFGDYDQDGEQDLFVANGIPKRPNDLDYINFVSSEQIQGKINNTKLMDQQALEKMPAGRIHNYVFRGSDDLSFQDESGKWIFNDTLISGATAVGDLDNDGDLDLVTNNLNSTPTLYINQTNGSSRYLKLKFKYTGKNPFGIGTKVFSYDNGRLQYQELHPVRGFQASSEPMVHFGYGKTEQIDSLKIVWPDGTYQVLEDVPTNQSMTVAPRDIKIFDFGSLKPKHRQLFAKVDGNLGLDFRHREDNYTDFNRQKLIPYQLSDRGPATALGDLNDDGVTDIFFGGSKFEPSTIYIQHDSAFVERHIPSIRKDSIKEDVAAAIADFTGDGKDDLIIGSGGGDFFNKMPPLLDSYYIQKDASEVEDVTADGSQAKGMQNDGAQTAKGFNARQQAIAGQNGNARNEDRFIMGQLPESFENASVVAPGDFDGDGDLDVFVGNQGVTNDFGKTPPSFLLKNDAGRFNILEIKAFENLGMVTDALWDDFDGDGTDDLIVVGEWMHPVFFRNENGQLVRTEKTSDDLNGLWQSIHPFDIDDDGDTDYLLGNWGTNSKFSASSESPLKMYYGDFDGNGQTETITATEKEGDYYPLENLDGLAAQMVSLKKKFTTYASFAGKSMDEIFDGEALEQAEVLEVRQLQSGYLRNDDGDFSFVAFQNELQVSPLMAFVSHDFDGDGKQEVLVAGNYFGVKPNQGRFDSFPGALIKSENDVTLASRIGLDLSQKSVRHLNIIDRNDQSYLLVTVNNDSALVYKLKADQKIPDVSR